MKLRVKWKNERATIDVNADDTIQKFMEKCQQSITNLGSSYLSLNNKEVLSRDGGTSLASLGLVNGDLVYLVQDENGASGGAEVAMDTNQNTLIADLLNMGFTEAHIKKAVNTLGARNIEDALNILTSINLEEGENSGSSKEQEMSMEQNKTLENRDLLSTMETLTSETDIQTDADYLCLAIHVLVSSAGFRLQTSSEASAETRDHPVANPPDGWKNSDLGFYRINYFYPASTKPYLMEDIGRTVENIVGTAKNCNCCFTSTVTGKHLLLSGVSDEEESDPYQSKLLISQYVSCADDRRSLQNYKSLSEKIKEEITSPLIYELASIYNPAPKEYSINTLPSEIKICLAKHFSVESMGRMASVSREWNTICNNNELWQALFGRHFRGSGTLLEGRNYKKMFKESRQRQRQQAEQNSLRRRNYRPDFAYPPDLIDPTRRRSPQMPGIIGGAHDLYPAPGFAPHGGPDLLLQPGRRGPPPGARFDPYSPFPDDMNQPDIERPNRRGRGIHPDLLPRFGDNPFL